MDENAVYQFPALTPLGSDTWAIMRDTIPLLAQAQQAARAQPDLAAHIAEIQQTAVLRTKATQKRAGNVAGGVAVLNLSGVLTPHGSFMSMLFGGGPGGLCRFQEQFEEAVSSPDIGAIVIDIDSPGGLTDLVQETGDLIYGARGEKPIIAIADTNAASGAYWLGCQADEFVVTPSGRVGAVGVYVVHMDRSKNNEQVGVAPTYVSAGKFKTDGNADEPLSDAARSYLQGMVDELYGMFVAAVARGRGVKAKEVETGYGEGRCLLAAKALAAGMVDRVATLDEVIDGLLGQAESGGTAAVIVDADTLASLAASGDQNRCPDCGKYLEVDKDTCDACSVADEDDDEPDEDERDDEEEEDQDEGNPKAAADAERRRRLLLLG